MGNGTQIFVGMFLLLQRISVVRPAVNLDFFGLDLIFLVAALRGNQRAADGNRRTGGQFFDVLVVGKSAAGDHLNIFQAGTVVYFDKRKIFRVAARSHPALDQHVGQRFVRRQQFYNLGSF